MTQKETQSRALTRPGEGAVTPWSPWNEVAEMRRQMDDWFARAFGYTPLSRLIPFESGWWEPDVDIYETEDKLVLHAMLPGYTQDQIHVEATRDTIGIHGERPALFEDEKAQHRRQSRASGFSRFDATYTLPTEIDPNKIQATFRNGVLQLEMPKSEQARVQTVKVNIASK